MYGKQTTRGLSRNFITIEATVKLRFAIIPHFQTLLFSPLLLSDLQMLNLGERNKNFTISKRLHEIR
jgi:hypothetical protein